MTAWLATIITYILRFFQIMLFVRAVLSWFPMNRGNRFTEFLEFCTEPLLLPVRKLLRNVSFLRQLPIDFSTIVVYLLLEILIAIL